MANKFFTIQPNLSKPVCALKKHERAFWYGHQGDPRGVSAGRGDDSAGPSKKEHKHMYKIYVLKNKKKILKQTTRSYSNMQGHLYALRKRGYVCQVEYPRRKA